MQAKLEERDCSVDAELRDVLEVMKLSEKKKMGRVKRCCVCLGRVLSCGKEEWQMCLAGE